MEVFNSHQAVWLPIAGLKGVFKKENQLEKKMAVTLF